MAKKGKLIIITGDRNAGKTNTCVNLINVFEKTDLQISGIISLGDFRNDCKVCIWAKDLKTSKKKQLAVYLPGWDRENPERVWKFNTKTLKWGNRILANSVPTDILIIDELGYLEFEKNQGWIEGIRAVDGKKYLIAFLVVRKNLLQRALEKWGEAEIFNINDLGDNRNLLNRINNFVEQYSKERIKDKNRLQFRMQ